MTIMNAIGLAICIIGFPVDQRSELDALLDKLEKKTARAARESKLLSERIGAQVKANRARWEKEPYSVGNKRFVIGAVGKSLSESLLKEATTIREELKTDDERLVVIRVEIHMKQYEVLVLTTNPDHPGGHRICIGGKRDRSKPLLL